MFCGVVWYSSATKPGRLALKVAVERAYTVLRLVEDWLSLGRVVAAHVPSGMRVRERDTMVNDFEARVSATYSPSTERWSGSQRRTA